MSLHREPPWMSRIGRTRVGAVLLAYLGAAWLVIEITEKLEVSFHFPEWFLPIVWVLLGIGFLVVLATALVQTAPPPAVAAPDAGAEGAAKESKEGFLTRLRRAAPWLERMTVGRSLLAGVGAFATLFVLSALFRGPSPPAPAAGAHSVAVLPFRVVGPQFEFLREGIVDLLSPGLEGVGDVTVLSPDSVLDAWHRRSQAGATPSREQALRVAQELGAGYALVGSVVSLSGEVRLSGQLYDARSGKLAGEVQVRGQPDSLNVLMDGFAAAVLQKIPGVEAKGNGPGTQGVATSSVPALKAYLEGEDLFRKADFDGAVAAYRRALQADSTFPLALYRLQIVGAWMEDLPPDSARMFVERAARVADKLPSEKAMLIRAELAYASDGQEGIRQLSEAVKKYPRNPEAWYLLGDASFHAGPTVDAGLTESERALARAVALDSTFAPAYIHLIELAFNEHADGAMASRLVAAYRRASAESPLVVTHRLALQLAFGPDPARQAVLGALDTLPFTVVGDLPNYLQHPRLWGVQAQVLARLRDRPEVGDQEASERTAGLIYLQYERGHLRDALAELGDRRLAPLRRAELLYVGFMTDLPLPPDRIERTLAISAISPEFDFRNFYAGAYAADQGRWAEHAEAVRRLEGDARRFQDEGNDWSTGLARNGAGGLRGYGAWKRDSLDAAFSQIDEAELRTQGTGPGLNSTLRTWLGKLYLQRGQPGSAEGMFGVGEGHSIMALQLGKTYEALGDRDHARRSYQWLTVAWAEADPELQPRVEEARRALERLER